MVVAGRDGGDAQLLGKVTALLADRGVGVGEGLAQVANPGIGSLVGGEGPGLDIGGIRGVEDGDDVGVSDPLGQGGAGCKEGQRGEGGQGDGAAHAEDSTVGPGSFPVANATMLV